MDDPTLLSWIEIGQNIAALLVAIGVAAEFALGFIAGPARRRVEDVNQAEIVRLTNTSAGFETEAAKLRKDAEQLKSDNLRLEAVIQPRDLSPEQRDAIQHTLQDFSGKFVLVLASPDPEAIRFAELIGFAISSKRNIAVQIGPLQEGFTIPPRTGVEVIGVDSKFLSALKHAIFSIGHAEPAPPLTQPRHSFGGLTLGTVTPKTPDATVYVGLKPLTFLQPN